MSAKHDYIEEFLENVKNKFPEWLKTKPDQLDEILRDLEQQILDKAREVSGMVEPDLESIKKATYIIGPPESIAKVYKKRGTPKFYITEELWDFYLRALIFSMAIVVVVSFIRVIVQIFFTPWYILLGDFLNGVYIGFLIVLVIVTGLFVFFSMEGYLPEDFGELPRYLGLIIQTKSTETVSKMERRADYRELPPSETKQKITEAKVKVKEGVAEAKQKIREARMEAKRKLRTVSTGELIAGAILGIVFGLLCMIQPFYFIETYFVQEFLTWLRTFGLVVLIGGLIELIRLAIGADNIGGQKVMLILNGIYNIAYFPLMIYLINHPDIFPIFLLSGFQINEISPGLALDIYHLVGVVIIIGLIVSILHNFYKAARLGEEV